MNVRYNKIRSSIVQLNLEKKIYYRVLYFRKNLNRKIGNRYRAITTSGWGKKKSAANAFTIASERAIQKKAEAIGNFKENKIKDKL